MFCLFPLLLLLLLLLLRYRFEQRIPSWLANP